MRETLWGRSGRRGLGKSWASAASRAAVEFMDGLFMDGEFTAVKVNAVFRPDGTGWPGEVKWSGACRGTRANKPRGEAGAGTEASPTVLKGPSVARGAFVSNQRNDDMVPPLE